MSGVGWGTISIATVTVFQLVFMGVMARLLNPADFGLVAIANVALKFLSYFAQMGISPALVQKPSLSDGEIRAALAISLGVSGIFFVAAVLTAGLVERFFEMNSLALVMRVLALNFIIVGFSSIQLGLIKRNRKFKALAIIEVVSYVVGYGAVGLSAAYFGAGVWALVAAFMSQSLLVAILGYAAVRHPLGLKHTKEQRAHLIAYGGRYSIIGFIEFINSTIDSLIVGKLMGATMAGYYNRSLLLANLPVQQPTRVLTQALFPILSTMNDQRDKLATGVELSALVVGGYAFAVGLGVSVAAPDIVGVLLGPKWLEAIPLLQILACSVGPKYVSNVIGISLDSIAELTSKLRIEIGLLALLAVLLLYAGHTGAVANVALAIVVLTWVRLAVTGWVVVRLFHIDVASVLKIALSVGAVTAASGLAVYVAAHVVFDGFSMVTRLIGEVLFGGLGLAVGLVFSRSVIARLPAVRQLAGRMPLIRKLLRI